MRTLFTGITEDIEKLRQHYGQDVVCTPLIEITEPDDINSLKEACKQLINYDYLLFTSRFAVRHCISLCAQIPPTLRIVSIGTTTTAELHKAGISNVEQVDKDNSYGVVEWFEQQARGKILFPRSDIALPIICDGLKKLGFDVHAITAYKNRMPINPTKVNIDDFDQIVFTSPSTVNHFVELYRALPTNKKLVARGPITQQAINNQLIKQQ
ncbi:MAG: uroporphyrinogen-III synthase [Bacteroidaceae bacterium]|nr:uroporphyrinogen-III synthase [Bacteroidaceae bacterium]